MIRTDWERIRDEALSLFSNGLTDHGGDASTALIEFASDPERGILRDAKVRSWLPQEVVDNSWKSPIAWMPEGFRPYTFQARAFARLSVSGQVPRPTAIAAPDGAGKSECFLLPMLDHCARQQGMGRAGVKAIILYASRAAASANAARIGTYCQTIDRFKGLRPGLLVDEFGSSDSVGPGFVIDSLGALTASPPDVLLTVPEMLDKTLHSKRHHSIWADATPASLRFIVVDDLHVYTDSGVEDLAILLRRLGTTLHMASPSQPLAGAVPVVTAGIRTEALVTEEDLAPAAPSTVVAAPTHSGLPRPSIDVRRGPEGLPQLSDTPTTGPGSSSPPPPPPSGLPGLSGGLPRPEGLPELPGLPGLVGPGSDDDDDYEPHPLLDLATYLFGIRFEPDSLVVDSPVQLDQLGVNKDGLPNPTLDQLAQVPPDDVPAQLRLLFGPSGGEQSDPVALGKMLLSHPLVRSVVEATHENPATTSEVARACGASGEAALGGVRRIVGLLGASRRRVGNFLTPLIRIEGQLGLGELPRVMRLVDNSPRFAHPYEVDMMDPAMIVPPGVRSLSDQRGTEIGGHSATHLPAVACRNCGASGWLAALLGTKRQKVTMPSRVDEPLGSQDGNLAILMDAGATIRANDESVRILDLPTLILHEVENQLIGRDQVGIVMNSDSSSVAQGICPVCGHSAAVDLLGIRSTQLLTVAAHNLVDDADNGRGRRVVVLATSEDTAEEQLDSIADESYLKTLRSVALQALGVQGAGSLSLEDLAGVVASCASDPRARYDLAPGDLQSDQQLGSLWTETPDPAELTALKDRIAFELTVELGRRSAQTGSLVATGRVSVASTVGDLDSVVAVVKDKVTDETGLVVPDGEIGLYLKGLVETLRLNGAIRTPMLDRFILEGGDPAFVGDRKPIGLAKLHRGEFPRFVTTAVESTFDSITAIHQRPGGARTWLVEWACSKLGVNAADAPSINWAALEALANGDSAVFGLDSMDGHRVYGLTSAGILVEAIEGSDENDAASTTPAAAMRVVSTMDQDRLTRARTEWQFKYSQAGERPNVLFMSAGHVRSDRDALDTSIDLGVIDSVIVEAEAVDQMGTVPELGRVGTDSGFGTIVAVTGDVHEQAHKKVPSLDVDVATSDVASVDTVKDLPAVPSQLRIDQDDFVDFLFDRVADDSIVFSADFETVGDLFDVADEVPSDPEPAELADEAETTIKFEFMPSQFVPEKKALFDTLEASAAKVETVDRFLRDVAPGHSKSDQNDIRIFAKNGVRPWLESLRSVWAEDDEVIDRTVPWHDALKSLQDRVGEADMKTPDESSSIRILLPIMDIQGWERVQSVAKAISVALRAGLGDAGAVEVSPSMQPVNGSNLHQGVVEVVGRGESAELDRLRQAPALRELTQKALAAAEQRVGFSGTEADLAREVLQHMVADSSFGSEADSELKQRELLRAFYLTLRVWIDRYPDIEGSLDLLDDGSLDLTINFAGERRLYRMDRLSPNGSSVEDRAVGPCLRISSKNDEWPTFDLFLVPLDGAPAQQSADADRCERALEGLREDGKMGWVLTWADVSDFYAVASAADAADAPSRQILTPQQRRVAVALQEKMMSPIRVDSLEQNAFALLLDVLARPDREGWAPAMASVREGIRMAGTGASEPERSNPADRIYWAGLKGLDSGSAVAK